MTQFDRSKYAFRFPNRFEFDPNSLFHNPKVLGIDFREIVYGLCGGMSGAAIDYFRAGKLVPTEEKVEKLPESFVSYLWKRQIDTLDGVALIAVFRWMLFNDETAVRKTSHYELPKLKRRIDKGDPTILAIIRVGGFGNPTLNHQVLAIGYEIDITGKITTIFLYEPNYPKKEVTLKVDKSGKLPVISQSTGEICRGFFVIEYDKRNPPE